MLTTDEQTECSRQEGCNFVAPRMITIGMRLNEATRFRLEKVASDSRVFPALDVSPRFAIKMPRRLIGAKTGRIPEIVALCPVRDMHIGAKEFW